MSIFRKFWPRPGAESYTAAGWNAARALEYATDQLEIFNGTKPGTEPPTPTDPVARELELNRATLRTLHAAGRDMEAIAACAYSARAVAPGSGDHNKLIDRAQRALSMYITLAAVAIANASSTTTPIDTPILSKADRTAEAQLAVRRAFKYWHEVNARYRDGQNTGGDAP